MNEVFLKEDFLVEINYLRLFFGLGVLYVLTYLIKLNYLKNTFSNDNKLFFTRNIYTFSIAITLIVTVIKSSLALSLGLIGALSIIRFRTAIKEPEQIITLLMLMAVSISVAAEKEILGILMTGFYILLNRSNVKDVKSNRKKILIISFRSTDSLGLDELNKFNLHRVYKTQEGNFTVEYILNSDELNEVINHFSNSLNLEIEYEIS